MDTKLRYALLAVPLAALLVALGLVLTMPAGGSTLSLGLAQFGAPRMLTAGAVPATARHASMIELEVKDVIPLAEADTHAVVLASKDRGIVLPIFVTEEAAVSIAFRLAQQNSPHPLAADLLDDVVRELGGKVQEIRIDSVRDEIYTSRVILKQRGGKAIELSARPSDAISLALTGHARIYCAQDVLAEAGITQEQIREFHQGLPPGHPMPGDEGPGIGGSGPDLGIPLPQSDQDIKL